jgi:hypothetical protein
MPPCYVKQELALLQEIWAVFEITAGKILIEIFNAYKTHLYRYWNDLKAEYNKTLGNLTTMLQLHKLKWRLQKIS